MAKKLIVPQSGMNTATVKPVAEEGPTPMQKMLHQERKKERTTICVDPELYKEFKMRTLANDTTVTAVLEKAMQEYIGE